MFSTFCFPIFFANRESLAANSQAVIFICRNFPKVLQLLIEEPSFFINHANYAVLFFGKTADKSSPIKPGSTVQTSLFCCSLRRARAKMTGLLKIKSAKKGSRGRAKFATAFLQRPKGRAKVVAPIGWEREARPLLL